MKILPVSGKPRGHYEKPLCLGRLALVTVSTLAVMNKALVRPDAASHEIWAQLSVLRAILGNVP